MSVDHELYTDNRYIQLDVLTRELRQELDSLNQQLRQLVNDSFDEFVLLGKSINLDTTDDADGPDLPLIRQELTHYATTVKQKQQLIATLAETARLVVDHRRKLMELKTEAKMGLVINDMVATFEKLLADPNGSAVQLIGVFLSIKLTFARLGANLRVANILRPKLTLITQEFNGFVATLAPGDRLDINLAVKRAESTPALAVAAETTVASSS